MPIGNEPIRRHGIEIDRHESERAEIFNDDRDQRIRHGRAARYGMGYL